LAEVKHQATAQRMLQRAISSRRVPHAYVFHGPQGVGKELLARGLAQLLLCEKPVENELTGRDAETVGVSKLLAGCGKCADCKLASAGTHPDLHLIYRQLNREHPEPDVRKRKGLEIGVDVLRHFVIDKVGMKPNRGRAKVFLIREADVITAQAQNALLKTLEEPPGTTYLILLVTSLDALLPTTLSRCQVVQFDALPLEFVRDRLGVMRPDLAPEQAAWYARSSAGSLGRALSMIDEQLFEVNDRVLAGLSDLPRSKRSLPSAWSEEAKILGQIYRKADPDITETEATRRGLSTVFLLAGNYYADLLRSASASADLVANAKWRQKIDRAGASMGAEEVARKIHHLSEAEQQLDLNANVQLCIEVLANELAA
jgi:DNA polymerase-3 subunit delta'